MKVFFKKSRLKLAVVTRALIQFILQHFPDKCVAVLLETADHESLTQA
jgi:hypothetical protein